MVDLHVHSTASDGTLTPKEVVDLAVKKGLTAFALTDHDTVAGLEEVLNYLEKLKKEHKNGDLEEIVPGIELSTDMDNHDCHVVGLYIDYKAPAFLEYLEEFVKSRDNRNITMCQKLTKHGVPITYEELMAAYPDSVITRAHFARYMVEKGYARNRDEVFSKYLGDHAPCYVPRGKITPAEAIELIQKAGGIPILAHPILYHLSDARLDNLVAYLKGKGLMGIEAVYSTYSPAEERQIRKLAEKYHLLLSGGSDFHGANKPNIDLGTGIKHLHVPDEFLFDIKASHTKILFTDMDGTLLNSASEVGPKLKAALERMHEKGHHLVLSSGRPLPGILEVKVKSGLNYDGMYIISNNGGLIYDCTANAPIRSLKLSPEIIRKVVDFAVESGIHVHSYTESEIVGFEDDEELKFYRSRIHMPFIKTDDIAGALPAGAFKVQLICLNDRSRLEVLKEQIMTTLGNEVDAFFSSDQYLEILPKGTNKGEAILYLADYLHIPHANTFAAGDADNDLSMIIAAGTGIAMQNATTEIKEAAEVITTLDNDHDGLVEIIEKYFLR